MKSGGKVNVFNDVMAVRVYVRKKSSHIPTCGDVLA
jgi:hypothetical protein